MRKVLISIGAGFAVLVALMLIVPGFVDWTPYRQTFAAAMSAATGRRVEIGGAMNFTLLPRPAFSADNVRIGDEGEAVAVERLSARLAFAPLLGGRMQFNSLILSRPRAEIMHRADGGFRLPATESAASGEAQGNGLFDVQVDHIEVSQGAVSLRDESSNTAWNAAGIDLVFEAETPEGPFTVSGALAAEGIPATVAMSFGRSFDGRSRPFSMGFTLQEAEASARFSGTLTLDASGGGIRGTATASGTSASALLASFGLIGAATPIPAALTQSFSLDGALQADGRGAALSGITLNLGGTPAKGDVTWQASAAPQVRLKLEIGNADLGAWALPSGPGGGAGAQGAQGAPGFRLPERLAAEIEVLVPAATLHGEVLRDGVLRAALAGGVLTIAEAGVTMPAASKGHLTGTLRAGDGRAVIDGAVDFETRNLRGFAAWLGYPVPDGLPSSRLAGLTLRGQLRGSPQRYSLSAMEGSLDTTGFRGALTVSRGARLGLNADLELDSLNLDAYGALFEAAGFGGAAPGGQANTYGVVPAFAALDWLGAFDADLHVQVTSLMGRGFTNGRAGIDLALSGGALKIRTLALENMAGASVWISGGVSGFGSAPRFDQLQFDLRSEDLARLGRAFDFDVPAALRGLSPATFTGVVSGGLVQSEVSGALHAGGLTVKLKGQLMALDQSPRYDFTVEGGHGDIAALARALDLTPPPGAAGEVSVSGRISGDVTAAKFDTLAVNVGGNTALVSGAVSRAQDMPEVTAEITGVAFNLDSLWPRDAVQRFTAAASAAGGAAPWPTAPLDWSFLEGWRGDVRVAGSLLAFRGFSAEDFNCRLTVASGGLEVSEWAGRVLGGETELAMRLAAEPVPQLQGQLAVKDGDLASFAALFSRSARPVGKVNLVGAFKAGGGSWQEMIESLAGAGTIAMNAAALGDAPLPGLLAPLTALQQAETLAQAQSRIASMTARGRLSASNGVMKLEQGVLESLSYEGQMSGVIDLAHWQVDLSGTLKSEGPMAMDMGGAQLLLPPVVPLTVKGPLDLPNVSLQLTDAQP